MNKMRLDTIIELRNEGVLDVGKMFGSMKFSAKDMEYLIENSFNIFNLNEIKNKFYSDYTVTELQSIFDGRYTQDEIEEAVMLNFDKMRAQFYAYETVGAAFYDNPGTRLYVDGVIFVPNGVEAFTIMGERAYPSDKEDMFKIIINIIIPSNLRSEKFNAFMETKDRPTLKEKILNSRILTIKDLDYILNLNPSSSESHKKYSEGIEIIEFMSGDNAIWPYKNNLIFKIDSEYYSVYYDHGEDNKKFSANDQYVMSVYRKEIKTYKWSF